MIRTRFLLLCCVLLLAACGGDTASSTNASAFPTRPIRVIVPFGPGGLAAWRT
ncbi:MAG TPA: hypothetical protein VNR18_11600 [Hyphomicrobiales bacterium]|nr:hypothetical protein [Hyphomicrobiales bacterium]